MRFTTAQQLTMFGPIADALSWLAPVFEARPDLPVQVGVDPAAQDQIGFHVHAPAELDDAALFADAVLGHGAEKLSRTHGLNRHHWWVGSVGGFSARVTWIEVPAPVDTQGRDPLPAGVGVGDVVADRKHFTGRELRQIKAEGPRTDAEREALAASGLYAVHLLIPNDQEIDVQFTHAQWARAVRTAGHQPADPADITIERFEANGLEADVEPLSRLRVVGMVQR